MEIRPKGQDTLEAFQEWGKDEIKKSTERVYDIGKFFFVVSTGTLGVIVSIAKLGDISKLDMYMLTSLFTFLISIFISMNMVRPRVWRLKGDTDLYDEYYKQVMSAKRNVRLWFITWLLALGTGIYATLKVKRTSDSLPKNGPSIRSWTAYSQGGIVFKRT
jgi:hypothetical protein